MSDEITRLASPIDNLGVDALMDGSALFAWLPPDLVLGRPSECVVVALRVAYRSRMFKPCELPPLAELVSLEDLGRALRWRVGANKDGTNELRVVAGETRDDVSGPLSVLRDLEKKP